MNFFKFTSNGVYYFPNFKPEFQIIIIHDAEEKTMIGEEILWSSRKKVCETGDNFCGVFQYELWVEQGDFVYLGAF